MFWKRTVKSQEYSESIINTVREPLIALDQDLRVVSVSWDFPLQFESPRRVHYQNVLINSKKVSQKWAVMYNRTKIFELSFKLGNEKPNSPNHLR